MGTRARGAHGRHIEILAGGGLVFERGHALASGEAVQFGLEAGLVEIEGAGVLPDKAAGEEDAGQALQVVGLDDLWAERFDNARALARLERARASLVLSHNPDTADLAGWGNWSGWILAGHTHGGQCKPPFLDPPLIPVQNRRYTAGEFDLPGGRRMYINRGLGHLLQVRFNVRPEVTLFRLCRA